MIRAKKSLGQNFLKSPAVVRTIVQTADIADSDTVLEIGPGKGVLTQELLNTGSKVLAIEKDTDLIPILREKFAKQLKTQQLTLINGDISDKQTLNQNLSMCLSADTYKIVANIPYNITGEILRTFLEITKQPTSMTLLVQKEVAQRIVAQNNKESILSISVKAYGEPKYIQKVPAMLFKPTPRVDSAIIHISNISKNLFIENNIAEKDFFKILKQGFSQKRKMLINNLNIAQDTLNKLDINPNARAETLTLKQWTKLTQELADML